MPGHPKKGQPPKAARGPPVVAHYGCLPNSRKAGPFLDIDRDIDPPPSSNDNFRSDPPTELDTGQLEMRMNSRNWICPTAFVVLLGLLSPIQVLAEEYLNGIEWEPPRDRHSGENRCRPTFRRNHPV